MNQELAILMFTDKPFYYREGNFGDLYTIKENINGKQYKKLVLNESDIILDIGAHIGTFAIPLAKNVSKIVSIEMDKDNYDILTKNTELYSNIETINMAVVSNNSDLKSVKYYRAKKNSGSHSIYVTRNRGEPLYSNTIKIGELFNKYSPTIIKCDAEGSEYDLFENLQFPNFVNQIIVEFHFGHKDWRPRANMLIKELIKQGFNSSDMTDMTENKNWTRVIYFERS